MTDTITFYRSIVSQVTQFIATVEQMQLISDRIGADSAMSAALAASAATGGRADLTTASFDNLKVVIDLVTTLLAAQNGGNVPVAINTGGTVKLGFYKIM